MATERVIGVEQARGKLGELVQGIAEGSPPVILVKRGRPLAALVSRDEYARFKLEETKQARDELRRRLAKVRRKVKAAGIGPEVIDEAIAAARRLR